MPFKDLQLIIAQIVLFLLFAFAGSGYASNFWLSVSAFFLTFGGMIVCGVSLLQLGSNLTPVPTPRKNGQLVETGIYKFVRHPIYSGLILTLTGIAVYNLSYPRMIITAIILFFFLYKSKYEESMLMVKYHGYKVYMNKTGLLFPKLIR